MEKAHIPVVFICDENYALPTAVAITSLKVNRKESAYSVYVLGVGLTKDSTARLNSLNGAGFSVFVKDAELSDTQKNVAINRERVTLAALLKFDLPVLFPEYDKLLYIDSDVLIQRDLAALFDTSVRSGSD